ncbi:MAG: hypothetical protein ACOWWR_01090 [Eubacteriales bacterium]
MKLRNLIIGGLGAAAGITAMKTMQNKGTQRKVKKAVNNAFNAVSDKVDNISNMDIK